MNGKWWIAGLAASFLTLTLIGLGFRWRSGSEVPDQPEAGGVSRVVVAGYVDLEQGVISLSPLVAGRVETILVREGEVVSAGAEMLRLESQLARHKLEQAEAGVKAAQVKAAQAREAIAVHQNKIAQQKEAVELAEERLAKAREFELSSGTVKQAEALARIERSKLDLLKKIDPTLDLKLAEANLAAQQAQLKEAEYGLDALILRAPANGVVLRVQVHVGDLAGPMAPRPAILFGAGQRRVVRFNVEQEFADRVQVGSVAELEDEANPALATWKGKVIRLGDAFLPTRTLLPQPLTLLTDETKTLEGIVVPDEGQPPLHIGQRLRVIIRRNR